MCFLNEEQLRKAVDDVISHILKNSESSSIHLCNVKCTLRRITPVDFFGINLDAFLKNEHIADYTLSISSTLDNSRDVNNKSSPVTTSKWQNVWRVFCKRFGISFVILSNGAKDIELTFVKPNVLPHISPIWIVIMYQDLTLVISPEFTSRFKLARILQFAHRNLPVNSEKTAYLILQTYSAAMELNKRGVFPQFTTHIFSCDADFWIYCDPVDAFLSTKPQKKNVKSHLDFVTEAWRTRKISNFDYVLALNNFAGRKRGEINNHPFVPWVVDFTSNDAGWRPLNMTKFRLQKGDNQLKEMFKREPAHHVPELLSELSYMVYRARIESKANLCKYVRSSWEPREYPISIERLYINSPDECIPELFEDPKLLTSLHNDMPDLSIPEFISSSEEFIKWHRAKFEADEVSAHLHEWIDLCFGYLLDEKNAPDSLNVHLTYAAKNYEILDHGVVQLFLRPHPKRLPEHSVKNQLGLTFVEESKLSGFGLDDVSVEDENLNSSLQGMYKKILAFRVNTNEYFCASFNSLLVTFAEISLPAYCQDLLVSVSLCQRIERIRTLLPFYAVKMPKRIQLTMQSLFEQIPNFGHDLDCDVLYGMIFYKLSLTQNEIEFYNRMVRYKALQLLRSSISEPQNETRYSNLLHGEINLIAQCMQNNLISLQYEIKLATMIADLLSDSNAACIVAFRLFPVVSRCFSQKGVSFLLSPIKKLLSAEHSIKLLDRRFLLQLSITYGAKIFLTEVIPLLVEAVASSSPNRSIVAKESIIWLAKRYGPVICARFVTISLLRIHPTCYTDLTTPNPEDRNCFNYVLEGDSQVLKVEQCLSEIAATYSTIFITVQYLPFCSDILEQASRRSGQEACFISALRIVHLSIKSFNDTQLMDYLETIIVQKVLFRAANLICTPTFSAGNPVVRRILMSKLLYVLIQLASRVGLQNLQIYAKAPYSIIFDMFVQLYDADNNLTMAPRSDANQDLLESFPLWFVEATVMSFCENWGIPMLTSFFPTQSWLVSFGCTHAPTIPKQSYPSSGVLSGNRIFSLPSPGSVSSNLIGGIGTLDSSGSLNQQWCAKVSAAVCNSGSRQSPRFDQMSMCAFSGHNATIRKLEILSNENSFVSASSDKTVKLWSIRHDLDTAQCHYTYKSHSSSVKDVCVLANSHIVSTDGILHLWDPFHGTTQTQLEWGSDGCITCLSQMDRHVLLASSNLHNSVKIFDSRCSEWAGEFRTAPGVGIIRCHAVKENNLAVATSNGTIAILDNRVGKLSSLSLGNYTHATSIAWMSCTSLIIADSDEDAVVFETMPKIERQWSTPGTVTCLATEDNILITLQQPNTLNLYVGNESSLSSKIKSDYLPGAVTSLAYLPFNNAFLLGSHSGSIRLVC